MLRAPLVVALFALASLFTGCSDRSDSSPPPANPAEFEPTESRDYRAITGVSMGGYGALNLGTKHSDKFRVIASLGGPVDMRQLLDWVYNQNLEVKELASPPTEVGDDTTYDLPLDYPDRDTRVEMIQDLVIAFGNPFLHHVDPAQAYLATNSQPALILQDNEYGTFTIPVDPRGFSDGGDANEDGLRQTSESPTVQTEVVLVARESVVPIDPSNPGTNLEERRVVDTDGDGVYDIGEGLVRNLFEPFTDSNGNGFHDGGEPFDDFGLDGVDGTGDFGEANGQHDFDPDVERWLAEDPKTRLEERTADEISSQRIYMDAGLQDEFEFATHYENLIDVLEEKGLAVTVEQGFSGDCTNLPSPSGQFHAVFYDGGHVGIPEADDVEDDLANGDFCDSIVIWQRILGLLGYVEESFVDGEYGTGGFNPQGEGLLTTIESPALAAEGEPAPQREVFIYRPPQFFNDDNDTFPIVYFLGGYGMTPANMEQLPALLDALIAAEELQNIFFVAVPGDGNRQGSFYVNSEISWDQVPGMDPTSGRHEDSLLQDLMPVIEQSFCEGRVRKN